MPSQPASGRPTPSDPGGATNRWNGFRGARVNAGLFRPAPVRTHRTRLPADSGYSREEWELLVRLPGQIMIAATSATPDDPGRTVAEGLAGLDAIAAGRASDADLVRAVVTAIYTEPDDLPPAGQEFADRFADIIDVLLTCRSAVHILTAKADPAESAAYRQWLQSIAERVCAVARTGDSRGGTRGTPAERRLLDDLAYALNPI